jgi:hypothetical protein
VVSLENPRLFIELSTTEDTADTEVRTYRAWELSTDDWHGLHRGWSFRDLGCVSIHDATNTLAQVGYVEVDQQADLATTQLQIRKQLGSVEWEQFFNCLDLDDDAVFDEKIHAITRIELYSLVNNRKPHLVPEMQAVDSELIVKARLVGAFKHSRTQCGVNFHSGMQNSLSDRFMEHQVFTSVSFVSSVVERFNKQMVSL